jgi:hypothetical protein
VKEGKVEMSNEHERPSQPPSQHMVIERRRVSSDGANVQVLELELSDTAREALNLPPKPRSRNGA